MISRLNRRRLIKIASKIVNSETLLDEKCSYQNAKSGAYNVFFKLTENWGVKVCRGSSHTNYIRQRRAWRLGCGPYCFGLMYVPSMYCYAYITETVTVFTEVCKDQSSYNGGRQRTAKENHRTNHLIRKLEAKLHFEFTDNGNRNMGVKGKLLVCIDFDNL